METRPCFKRQFIVPLALGGEVEADRLPAIIDPATFELTAVPRFPSLSKMTTWMGRCYQALDSVAPIRGKAECGSGYRPERGHSSRRGFK